MKIYIVDIIEQDKTCNPFPPYSTASIRLQWADGMLGVMPVFASEEDAKAYVGDMGCSITELDVVSLKEKGK